MELSQEKTLILFKADCISRGLVGECIKRFEEHGFKIRGLKMMHATEDHMRKHYGGGEEWVRNLGQRTLEDLARYGKDPMQEFGSVDTLVIGNAVLEWLISYVISTPLIAMVVSGPNAAEMGRKIVGNTIPQKADVGSIRGDYSIDSPMLATLEKRAITNLIHASGNKEEAEMEVTHWFKDEELCS